MAAQKEREESLKTKLSAWDRRVAQADSVTLHPWETGRYDQRDGGICVSVCLQREGGCHGEKGRYMEKDRDNA